MITWSRVALVSSALLLTACASTFTNTWKDPNATPLEMKGQKVAAVVMIKGESSRRSAEDALAREITARGAQGVSMYTIAAEATPGNEAANKAAFEKAGIQGVVVMRPVSVDKEVTVTPVTSIQPYYGGYWGGYYGYGWGAPYAAVPMGNDIRVDTVVYIETLVYSLKQNKLVWSGQSKKTNPENVDAIVRELSYATAKELEKEGLVAKQ